MRPRALPYLVGQPERWAFTWWDDALAYAIRAARRSGLRQQVKRRHGFWEVTER